MNAMTSGALALLLSTAGAADDKGLHGPATPANQYKALVQEFYEQTHVFSFKAKTEEERKKAVERMDKLRLTLLELAEKNPKGAVALDALTQVVTLEVWLENNTTHP